MVHYRNPEHPEDPVERPQVYNWHEFPADKKISARLILPFISTKYKTDVTIACILRCMNDPTINHDEEHDDHPTQQLLRESPLWHAPPIERHFDVHTFFTLYRAEFRLAAPLLFHYLRNHIYGISEEDYQTQFHQKLRPVDGLGFSGSLFFYTDNRTLIIKSIGRKFEYTFLFERMIDAMGQYFMSHGQETLLCRITDVLYTFDHRLGGYLGISPAHYVVMSNLLAGLDKERGCKKWDLKPQNFFEPTRDLVPDAIKTEAAKTGLADELDEQMMMERQDKMIFMGLLERDLEFLDMMGTIDYSLLLGKYPVEMFEGEGALKMSGVGERDFVKGVRSGDGKWVYRMCLVDYLWNVDQLVPKIQRVAGKLLPEQTVTTEPRRYRDEFMKMMDSYITIYEG